MTNGPNGSSAAMRTAPDRQELHFASWCACVRAMQNAMNSMPCSQPAKVTACGMPAKYFSGMAIPNNTINEMPSIRAMVKTADGSLEHKHSFINSNYIWKTVPARAIGCHSLPRRSGILTVRSQIHSDRENQLRESYLSRRDRGFPELRALILDLRACAAGCARDRCDCASGKHNRNNYFRRESC